MLLVWIPSANYDMMGGEARLRAEQRMERDFYEDGFHASAPQKACIFSPGWLENVVARAQSGVLQLANQKAEHPKRGTLTAPRIMELSKELDQLVLKLGDMKGYFCDS